MTDARFTVWIIAPLLGTGTRASGMRLKRMFEEEFDVSLRPAAVRVVGVEQISCEGSGPTVCGHDSFKAALKEIAEHTGSRWVWVIANTTKVDEDRYIDLDGTASHPPTWDGFWAALARAATNRPRQPLIATVDACHAAPKTAMNEHDNFAWICSSAAEEKARSTDGGAWMTLNLVDRLLQGPGPVKLQDLVTHLADCRDQTNPGQRPISHLGELATRVLNQVGEARAVAVPLRLPRLPGPEDALAAWRQYTCAMHQDLFPVFGAARVIEEVFVELGVARSSDGRPEGKEGAGEKHGSTTLPALLATPGRFAVLGEPGSGKSTLARHHAATLGGKANAPLPVYLSLPGFALSRFDNLFDYAGSLLHGVPWVEPALAELLPSALRSLLQHHPGDLCLLLDGLDEVAGSALTKVRSLITQLANHKGTRLAVFSRPMGYTVLPGLTEVRVQPLDTEGQRRLLQAWLGDAQGKALLAQARQNGIIAELAGYPLMLTLLALVWRQGGPEGARKVPPTRWALFDQALRHLLECGYRTENAQPVPKAASARTVLRHLSLALQLRGGEQWPLDELARTLRLLESDQPQVDPEAVEQQLRSLGRQRPPRELRRAASSTISEIDAGPPRLGWWQRLWLWLLGGATRHRSQTASAERLIARAVDESPDPSEVASERDEQFEAEAAVAREVRALHGDDLRAIQSEREQVLPGEGREEFLKLVGQHAGILAPHDGPNDPWRYLHRALRDALCAEQLHQALEQSQPAVLAFASQLESDAQVGRWAETFALLTAQSKAPLPLLKALANASGALGRRAITEADALDAEPKALVELLTGCEDWDGEDLRELALRWRSQPTALAAIADLATPKADIEVTARVHYALSEVGALEAPGAEDAFFQRIGRPRLPAPDLKLAWSDRLEGTFVMGTPEGSGYNGERPAHEVTLSPFHLGRFAVTKAEFRRFEPEHDCPGGDRHPVTRVTWYLAQLYARWARADLPTEAQWECACRAGTQSAWSFGDDESKFLEHAWYDENLGRETHPVGEKRPNPWGLYDLHGNVGEWCRDWFESYSAGPVTDPPGPEGGVSRDVRGGGWWGDADWCRSAFRSGDHPANRHVSIGFRLCRRPQLEPGH